MKRLFCVVLLNMAIFMFSAGDGWSLPPCPENQNQRYHNCFGTHIYTNGNKYVGEFKNSEPNGHGTFTFADGTKYVGRFKNSEPNGHGTLTFGKGDKYVGEFKDGIFNGQGTLTKANGDKYVGEFRDNKKNGQGTFTSAGGKYVGEFKDENFNGQGTVIYTNGYKYVGEFKDHEPNGKGIAVFPEGGNYVGEFKDSIFNGQGIFTFPDGSVREGIWKNGEFQYALKVTPTVTAQKPKEPSSDVQNENERLRKEVARRKEEKKQKAKTPEVAKVIPKEPTPNPSPQQAGSSGSGFFVSKMGHVITNAHVVKGCQRVTVGDNANTQLPAEVISSDTRNDLALLKLSSLNMASSETKALVRKLEIKIVPLASDGLLRSDDVELGEKVMVAGYPYGDIFSNTIKVTGGMVSATRGMGDDTGQFQLDAAVQPGNSGGPIYDEYGNVVGVVVSQLNKLNVAKAIGSMPENVNFGIKASTVRQFLTASGLPSKWSQRSKELSNKQLAKIAQNQALMVVCH